MDETGPFEKPRDEDILEQEEAIRSEIAASCRLVGERIPLSSLKDEYSNETLRSKIEELASRYASIQRIRGDGNCFYRACLCGLLESVCKPGNPRADTIQSVLSGWRQNLVDCGFQELVFEDSMDMLLVNLQQRSAGESTSTIACLQETSTSNFLVMLLRMITAAQLQVCSDHYEPFLLNYRGDCKGVQDFCEKYVLPMGVESDHVHAVAFAEALGLHIRVEYLDQNEYASYHDFGAGASGDGKPDIVLLYRPGHYDIIHLQE